MAPRGDLLGTRALNRALLARQSLLERATADPEEMVRHLVGMQGQNPHDPYYGLWARVDDFDPAELSTLLVERRVVRAPLMRTTVHLVTAADGLEMRALHGSLLRRVFESTQWAKACAGIDVGAAAADGRRLIEEDPLTRAQFGKVLAERHPGPEPVALGWAVTYLVPVVQVPPRGVWGATAQARFTTMEGWLGAPLPTQVSPDDLVMRYLAAFGPAAPKDARTWCGLNGLGEVFERLGPRLRRFRTEDAGDVFDLPDAPRPDPDVAAPPRLLPEYDNVLLAHHDRSRIIPPGVVPPGWAGNLLVDGFHAGWWKVKRTGRRIEMEVQPQRTLSSDERESVEGEARRLLDQSAGGSAEADLVVRR